MNFKSVIKSNGRIIELLSTLYSDSGDEWNPENSDSVEDEMYAIGVTIDKDDIDGTLIKQTDVAFLAYYIDREITTSDKIKDGSLIYNVVGNKVIKPGNIILAQKIFCRK